MDDLRSAVRLVRRSPGFAAVVVLTIAIAIGATTSVFSVVRGLLLKPLPFREPEKLVRFYASSRLVGNGTISWAEFRQDHENLKSTSGVAAWAWGSGSLAGADAPEHIGLGRATASLLPVLGVQPAYGRWFGREEEEPGHGRVVVLGKNLWQRRFAGDPGVVGQTVEIMGAPFKVIGVLADELDLPENFDAWRPLTFSPDDLTSRARANRGLRVIGRLKGSLADLRSELSVVSARLRAEYPEVYPPDLGFEMTAVPLLDQMVKNVRATVWMLFAAVVLVLLMACANVGNLLLARASTRERELAVRAALGAGRSRLVRQMLVESLFLALIGGALGILLATWGVDLLLSAGPADLPRARDVRIDGVVLAFALLASIASGLVFGLLPALTATQTRLFDALRGGSASSAPNPRRLRRALVVADVALALILVSGAALLLRSFSRVVDVDPGFRPEGAVAFTVVAPKNSRQVFRTALQRIRELPGVGAAGGVDYSPLSGVANDGTFEIEGRPVPAGSQPPDEEVRIVTPGWFEAIGIRLIKGRTPQDVEKTPIAVVNESLARKYGLDLGARIKVTGDDRWWTIEGIVGDVREFGLDTPVRPTLYFPLDQMETNSQTIVVRSKAPAREVLRDAQRIFAGIDPLATAWKPERLADTLAASLAQRSFALELLHGFAALALLLAGLGLYGVLAYAVAQRTREIGVRMALGARPIQALALVARESAAVVGAGILIGCLGALAAARAFASLLFGVGPADPLSLAAAVLVLGAVALLATLLPARRAAHVDPVIALRAE